MHHAYTRDSRTLPPLVCHIFSKQDRVQKIVKKRNSKVIANLAKNGVIGNYLYVASKTNQGMKDIKKAILDADIVDHGDKIFPEEDQPKKSTRKPNHDPYEDMVDEDMPQAIPGLLHS